MLTIFFFYCFFVGIVFSFFNIFYLLLYLELLVIFRVFGMFCNFISWVRALSFILVAVVVGCYGVCLIVRLVGVKGFNYLTSLSF